MAYKVIILYQLYMPSYFLGTFTEYPYWNFPMVVCIFNKEKCGLFSVDLQIISFIVEADDVQGRVGSEQFPQLRDIVL